MGRIIEFDRGPVLSASALANGPTLNGQPIPAPKFWIGRTAEAICLGIQIGPATFSVPFKPDEADVIAEKIREFSSVVRAGQCPAESQATDPSDCHRPAATGNMIASGETPRPSDSMTPRCGGDCG